MTKICAAKLSFLQDFCIFFFIRFFIRFVIRFFIRVVIRFFIRVVIRFFIRIVIRFFIRVIIRFFIHVVIRFFIRAVMRVFIRVCFHACAYSECAQGEFRRGCCVGCKDHMGNSDFDPILAGSPFFFHPFALRGPRA